ncbi:helix-turn-helix domain-containing protein [Phytoactinopolyspora halotolerans]|uniref:Helix-turn-helix domain-containing protein n=1 Tax=Phytoactinopolyspora halotolerans TaxID=1981512 RepID=A0A6L9S870_9ACTN|nr:helix-turn-helix domain-containing protein [Phytoactinopolyspora halotolerans]
MLPVQVGDERRRWYSVAEVAQMFGMSPMTLYRAISDGEFPAVRIRGRLIVPAKALEAMENDATQLQALVDAGDYVSSAKAL